MIKKINVKERLIGAITVMSDSDAIKLWDDLQSKYAISWDDIEEEAPDEIDLAMLADIKTNPDCHTFMTTDELEKFLEVSEHETSR